MKVSLEIFKSNNKDLKASDIISNVHIGETSNGITILKFNTVDKYHYVEVDGGGPDYFYISVRPILYCSTSVLGNALCEHDFDAYLKDPDYYILQLKVNVAYSEIIITPLKHLYHVTFVPDHILSGHVDFEQVELGDPVWGWKKEVE